MFWGCLGRSRLKCTYTNNAESQFILYLHLQVPIKKHFVSYLVQDQGHGLADGVEQCLDQADEPDGAGADLQGVAGADGLFGLFGFVVMGLDVLFLC